MDNATLLHCLRQTPTARLGIFDLMDELVRPDGEIDPDIAGARQEDIDRVSGETKHYIRGTGRLIRSLACTIKPSRC